MSQLPGTTDKTSDRAKKSAWLVVAAIACVGAFWYGMRADSNNSVSETLVIEPNSLHIGTVWEQADFIWDLPMRNQSDYEVEVLRFATSCPCVTRIEPASFKIPARQTTSVRVIMNLVRGTEKRQEGETRDFKMRLMADIRGAQSAHAGWVLTAKTREATRLSSREVVFWNDVVRGQEAPMECIDLTSAIPLKRLGIKLDPSALKVEVIEIPANTERERGLAFRLNVTPTNGMPSGPFSEEFSIEPVAETGEKLPSWKVKAIGTMVEGIQAFPRILEFGAVPLGEVRSAVISLRSVSGDEFSVEKTETSAESISVEKQKTAPSEQTFNVAQRAVAAGSQVEEIRFLVRDHDKRNLVVVVRTNYYGAPRQNAPPKKNVDN